MANQIKGLSGFYWVYPDKDNPWGEKVSTRTAFNPLTGEKLTVRQAQTEAHGGVSYEKRKAREKGLPEKKAPEKPKGTSEKKGTGKKAPVKIGGEKGTPEKPKITALKGTKGYGRYVKHQRNKEGQIVRTRVNATSVDTLRKQFDRVPDGSGIILHFVNSRTGQIIKAVSHGRNHTAKAGDLRRWINEAMKNGASWDDAFWGAVGETFSLYDQDGNPVSFAPEEFTNVIMYTEYSSVA